jgi:hypothetical protein
MDEALKNDKVPSIDGVDRQELVKARADLIKTGKSSADALRLVTELASYQSRVNNQSVAVIVSEAGAVNWVDLPKWTGGPSEAPPALGATTNLAEISGPSGATYNAYVTQLATEVEQSGLMLEKYSSALEGTNKVSGGLGNVLMGLSFANMALKAQASYVAGNEAAALAQVRDWSLGTAGAVLLGGVAFEGTAALVAPLALLGPLGIGVALIAAIGTSLLMAYWGHQGGVAAGEFITKLGTDFNAATLLASPIILDLDGDGVSTLDQARGTRFDHNADGLAKPVCLMTIERV